MHVRIDMLREIDLRRCNVCGGFSFLKIEDYHILCRVKAIMLILHESVNLFLFLYAKGILIMKNKASGCVRKGMAFFYTQKQVADLKKLPF